ncbi:Pimeloyl-ACP methyl ester carboxylesterase [Nocardioides scoriae]|uniref:Pimeloyl-ACP methyl ester carboxylesterase n=1 Tax=Nocardioides scoriae TaxID=642780 RepID=A0A1H1Y821_9ACTN|nr:alpha/beta hydrolase [Nocardioides scoriae]SDT17567.1 Pimeloyl-ACP methyl ester carboxylesterase [Nocardioides scoriae]
MADRALTLAPPADDGLALRYYAVPSRDGTVLQAWTNDVEGPTVLLCNGLGTNPYAWPSLLDPACGVRVVSWNHRGTGGSHRPVDREHVGIDAFAEDALAVMDHAGLDSAVLMGWSMGVNTMFEVAVRHPERVDGLFAVGGVPGDTFASMLAPLRVPRPVSKALTVGAARVAKVVGRGVTPWTTGLAVGPATLRALSHSGFMLPVADEELSRRAVREFLSTPVEWYAHLALHSSLHRRVSLRGIEVPTSFLAGRYDVLASSRDMRTAADRIPGAVYEELRATHFLPMERPHEVITALRALLARVG